jgi:hypothetical protein
MKAMGNREEKGWVMLNLSEGETQTAIVDQAAVVWRTARSQSAILAAAWSRDMRGSKRRSTRHCCANSFGLW